MNAWLTRRRDNLSLRCSMRRCQSGAPYRPTYGAFAAVDDRRQRSGWPWRPGFATLSAAAPDTGARDAAA